jgi:hypothetical protein
LSSLKVAVEPVESDGTRSSSGLKLNLRHGRSPGPVFRDDPGWRYVSDTVSLRGVFRSFRHRSSPEVEEAAAEEEEHRETRDHGVGAPGGGGIIGTAGLAAGQGVGAAEDDLESFEPPPDRAP